jgi:hypothetical protein
MGIAGCHYLPTPRHTLLLPGGTVVVRDLTSGAPLAGSIVEVRREVIGVGALRGVPPPPRKPRPPAVLVATAQTDARGEARFTPRFVRDWLYPFTEGVPLYGWDVCARNGARTAGIRWLEAGLGTEPRM